MPVKVFFPLHVLVELIFSRCVSFSGCDCSAFFGSRQYGSGSLSFRISYRDCGSLFIGVVRYIYSTVYGHFLSAGFSSISALTVPTVLSASPIALWRYGEFFLMFELW